MCCFHELFTKIARVRVNFRNLISTVHTVVKEAIFREINSKKLEFERFFSQAFLKSAIFFLEILGPIVLKH